MGKNAQPEQDLHFNFICEPFYALQFILPSWHLIMEPNKPLDTFENYIDMFNMELQISISLKLLLTAWVKEKDIQYSNLFTSKCVVAWS